jgi:hypothetical protein
MTELPLCVRPRRDGSSWVAQEAEERCGTRGRLIKRLIEIRRDRREAVFLFVLRNQEVKPLMSIHVAVHESAFGTKRTSNELIAKS